MNEMVDQLLSLESAGQPVEICGEPLHSGAYQFYLEHIESEGLHRNGKAEHHRQAADDYRWAGEKENLVETVASTDQQAEADQVVAVRT